MERRRKLVNLSMISLVAIVLPVRPGAEPPKRTEPLSGQAAITALGGNLAATARLNGLTVNGLRDRLRDPTFHVDVDGRLLVADTDVGHVPDAPMTTPAPTAAPAAAAPAVAPAVPYVDTFRLHSRPGANRIVYLDFDGFYVNGTAWNRNYSGDAAFQAEGFTLDGSAAFSNAEMDVVQRVWQRVSEDFAPFVVDVTTEEPAAGALDRTNSADQTYGTRVVITNNTIIASSCGCGGIAYVGVFDQWGDHETYQPAFVFTSASMATNDPQATPVDKVIGEAASHEVGHTLGLVHDGANGTAYYAGQANWAPIMGVGYYKPVTQWSRGEYTGADNVQDDLTVIQNSGLVRRPDDHGDATSLATMLAGPNLAASGVISTATDKDVFGFLAGAGGATFTASPAEYGPDLDIRLELLDGAGTVIAQADPASGMTSRDVAYGLGASLTVTLTPGTYYVRITGTGMGNPLNTGYSSYASLGQYTLTGTVGQATSGNVAPVAVVSATPTAAVPGQTIAFSSGGSLDPDGTIVAYQWSFGDGTSSTLANPSKAYTVVGSYTASLTVVDSGGAVGSASIAINVLPASVRVQSIRPSLVTRSGRTTATALVTVTDSIGRPVRGATVRANWTGSVRSPASGVTGTLGTVLISSPSVALRSATFTITVADVVVTGKPYNAVLNLVTSATVRR